MKEKSCGAVVIQRMEGEYRTLLLYSVGGRWGFPKGHTEGEETEEETALREIREETGLIVRLDTRFRHAVHYRSTRGNDKEVAYFVATPVGGALRLQAKEIADCAWLPFNAATRALLTYATSREVYDRALPFLEENYF